MNFPEAFKAMIMRDIQSIDESCKMPLEAKLRLHRQLDGRYQACVKNWYNGLWGVDRNATQIYYGSIENSHESIQENLELMKAKLETFQFQMNVAEVPSSPSTQVNVTTNVSVNITFEQVRSKIEDMTSLTDEQTREALEKVAEIEDVVKGEGSKKSKWEKIKPILTWLADKSFDVAMTMLPLLLQVQG